MKTKSMFFVATLSIISSAAVFAADNNVSAKAVAKQADTKVTATTKSAVKTTKAAKVGSVKSSKATVAHKETSLGALQKQLNALQSQIADMQKKETVMAKQQEATSAGLSGSEWGKLYAYGPAISTTPIIGTPDYAGWDLYINVGTANEDMGLMQRRQQIYKSYAENGIAAPERPVIALSGEVEGQIWNYSENKGHNENDIDLNTVALEAVINANEWVNGMIKFVYLDQAPSNHDSRASTGNILLDRAYLTVGNLDKFPIFGSVGQMKIPFDMDANDLISSPVTQNLGKMVERPLVLGFGTNGFYGKTYVFKGDVYKGEANSVINNFGGMLGYKGPIGNIEKLSVDVGAGAIRNLADALGLQNTGNSTSGQFQGFGTGGVSKAIHTSVPGVSAHAIVNYAPLSFISDYVGAAQSFDQRDMTFNGKGAKPQAVDLELQYSFTVLDKPSSVAVAFDRTWQALAANLPKYSYFVVASTSMLKRTVQSIEWRHDIGYSGTDVATGAGLPVTAGIQSDQVIASFKVFF